MLNKKDLNEMKAEMANFDLNREKVIKKARDVIKLSKKIIYSIHRNNIDEGLIKEIKKEKEELEKYIKKNKGLYYEGSFKVAIQEYVEAMLYYGFVKSKKVFSRKELEVQSYYYLLGLCDLSGELVRRAIHSATAGKYKDVEVIRNLVDDIYGTLLEFNIRENELRKKFDSIKYDIKKLDDLNYDLKVKRKVK